MLTKETDITIIILQIDIKIEGNLKMEALYERAKDMRRRSSREKWKKSRAKKIWEIREKNVETREIEFGRRSQLLIKISLFYFIYFPTIFLSDPTRETNQSHNLADGSIHTLKIQKTIKIHESEITV